MYERLSDSGLDSVNYAFPNFAFDAVLKRHGGEMYDLIKAGLGGGMAQTKGKRLKQIISIHI